MSMWVEVAESRVCGGGGVAAGLDRDFPAAAGAIGEFLLLKSVAASMNQLTARRRRRRCGGVDGGWGHRPDTTDDRPV